MASTNISIPKFRLHRGYPGTLPYLTTAMSSMVRFQQLTGSLPEEVAQLWPMDLDCSGAVWEYPPASHKTEHYGKARTIYIGPQGSSDPLLWPNLYELLEFAPIFGL